MRPSFSGWKEGFLYYGPPLAVGAIVAFVFGGTAWGLAAAGVFLFFGLFALFFFRDPVRAISEKPGDIVSPADGTIVGIEEFAESPHYDGPCRRVSIFLSVLNVHINRSPFEGTIEAMVYKPGMFKNAMRADTSQLNESNTIRMTTPRGAMTVRQISGLIARRIVCPRKVGDALAKGEKFGMIKFGSRTELYLPMDAEICVRMKDKVAGGATVVARFPER